MKKQNIKLSDLQISVMKVLWTHGKLSVNDTHQILNQTKSLALTTVATLLKRMEEKDIVGFEKVGRQHLFFPLISEADVKSSMLGNMLSHLFNGKPEELVHHLIDQEEVSETELALIRQLLKNK